MTTKKKSTTTINYLGTPSSINEKVVNQIPNYPNSGVSFQGYYKIDKGNNNFEIKQESENSIDITFNSNLAGLAAGTYVINRAHPEERYVFDRVMLTHNITGIKNKIYMSDSNNTNGINFYFPGGSTSIVGFNIIPKIFDGSTIRLVLDQAIPANEFITISLYGWYETK